MHLLGSCQTADSLQSSFCRTAEEMFIYMGARIGYWRGDIKGLVDDIGGWPHDGMLCF